MGKRLYRSVKNKMLGGVCSGIGDYLDIDPTIIRLLFVILTFAGFAGGLAYLIAWLVIPEETTV